MQRHGHFDDDLNLQFHEHPEYQHKETNYPGAGLDAATEAFNAYKLWREKQRALSPEEYVKYDKLVWAHDVQLAEQRRAAEQGGQNVRH